MRGTTPRARTTTALLLGLSLVAVLAAPCRPLAGQEDAPGSRALDPVRLLGRALQAEARLPGFAVAVADAGGIALSEAWGM